MRHMELQRRELEIKLELTAAQLRRLRARINSRRPDDKHVENLTTTYFDTPDWALRAEGIVLRVRRIGDAWIKTLKAERRIVGGVSNPIELEAGVSECAHSIDAFSHKKLRRKLERLTSGTQLASLFKTVVKQSTSRITTPGGDEIEIAIDEGRVTTASQEQMFR